MKLDDRLRLTDDRLLPTIAARLAALVDRLAERRVAVQASVRRTAKALTDPRTTAPLRRLDDRYAKTGPLALVREVPQLGMLVAAAIFLTGSVVVLERSGSEQRAAEARQHIETTIPTTLGPAPGTSVAAYLATTRKRAALVSQAAPDGTYTALVSFSHYVTASQAHALLGDLVIHKVLAHVPLPNAEVLPIPVTSNIGSDVATTFAAVARRKAKDRREFANLAASITGTSKEEQQFKAFYLEASRTAAKESAAYGKSCACLFGALVRGKARDLATLPALAGIRAVDIGGGDDDTLQLQPLLPEQTKIVTRPATPGSANGA